MHSNSNAPIKTHLTQEEERILFLYVSPNGGHKECANAVKNAFKIFYPSTIQTIGTDTIAHSYPILGPLIARTYIEVLRYTPQIWNFLYDNSNIEEITREFRQLFNSFNAPNLKSLIQEYRPTAFVCTQAIPCGVIAEQKRRGNCHIPLVAIMTDYAVHSYWIYPEVDLYIVANQESQKTLIERKIPEEKIKVYGIPIDLKFNKKMKQRKARIKLGLEPDQPVILVMGGSRGLGSITKITKEILSIQVPLQLVIVTGINEELKRELSHTHHKFKNLHIYGYTQLIPVLMDAADLLVTKPGGLTCSEALAKELPMILVNPIPGQEERNAHYILKNGAAVQVKKVEELKEVVKQFLHQPERLKLISEKSKKISKPFASWDSMEEIVYLLNKGKNGKRPLPSQNLKQMKELVYS